ADEVVFGMAWPHRNSPKIPCCPDTLAPQRRGTSAGIMISRIFASFEKPVDPFRPVPIARPPEGLMTFYWHFVRQSGWVFVAALGAAFIVAIVEVSLFRYIGQIVDLLQSSSPAAIFSDHGGLLLWMAFVVV